MRVFDFDNTIYDGESGMDIFLYYLKRDPKGVAKFVPKFMEGFLKYKRHLITIEEVKTEYASYVKEYFERIENIQEDFEHPSSNPKMLAKIVDNYNCKFYAKLTNDEKIELTVKDKDENIIYTEILHNFIYFENHFKIK